MAGFEDFDARAGKFGLDDFGLGFELGFIDNRVGSHQFGEDRSDIAETEDVVHFDHGGVGRSFQRGFLDVLDILLVCLVAYILRTKASVNFGRSV